jgi:hypothetical protein
MSGSDAADPPSRIPCRNGDEQDVFSRYARRIHRWTWRAGACRTAKRAYSRRLRSIARGMLKGASGDRDGCGG